MGREGQAGHALVLLLGMEQAGFSSDAACDASLHTAKSFSAHPQKTQLPLVLPAPMCPDGTAPCVPNGTISHEPCRVVYGDRDVQHTLRRLAETVDLQQLLRMASGSGMPEPPAVRVLF